MIPRVAVRRCLPLGGVLLGLLASIAPAHADYAGSQDMWSTAVVTRLSMTGGHGWLTVQPTFRTGFFSGFHVLIPAGDGAWTGPSVVDVPELDTTCRLGAGPGLRYDCGQTALDQPYQQMPIGGYQVTIPVSYSGDDVSSLWGTSDVLTEGGSDGFEYIGSWNPDTFPVYDGDHFRSSAELRVARLTDEAGTVYATLPLTVTVVPGEQVTALTVPFLGEGYRLVGTNAASRGLQCYVRVAENDLHCKPAAGTTSFPTGRYTVTARLTATGGDPNAGTSEYGSPVLLGVDGQPPETVDTGQFASETYN